MQASGPIVAQVFTYNTHTSGLAAFSDSDLRSNRQFPQCVDCTERRSSGALGWLDAPETSKTARYRPGSSARLETGRIATTKWAVR